ncbi:MAG: glutamine amidotransferase [Verrucomicrobiota bacterium]
MTQFTYVPDARWLIGGVVFTLSFLVLSYYWAKGRASWRLRSGLIALRALAITGVVICLLDPEWVEEIKRQPRSRLAVLLDTSKSMSVKDVQSTRLAAAKGWVQETFGASVPSHVAIDFYEFGEGLAPVASFDNAMAEGKATALNDALDTLLSTPQPDPLSGVILCSDGIDTMSKNPELLARAFRRKGIPIHTLTVGTTNEMQDIVVENIHVKRAVPNEAPTRIGVTLRSSGFRDRTVPVQVLQGNKLVAMQELRLARGAQKLELDFTPRQRGFQMYEVRVPVQAGEWLPTNNRRVFGVEVVDPTIRVIYMEGTPQQPNLPLPEWKYLKDALESDPDIKVKTLYRQFGNDGQFVNTVDVDPEKGDRIYPVEHPTQGFPRTLDKLLEYDVIIHSDIKKESFTSEQLQNMARLVEEFGGGFVMIGGNSAFGKGGYHRTILDRIIPVAMQQENDSQARQIRLRVPAGVYAHPIIALGATRAETEMIWTQKLPVLYGMNLVDRAKPGAIVLGDDPTSANAYGPRLLLAVQNIGKGRSMAFTSDTTRSWGRDFETLWGERLNASLPLTEANCDARYYRKFWVNAVRWLAAGRLGRTNSPVALELAQSYALPNERVAAQVKVRGSDLRELTGAEVTIYLSSTTKTNQGIPARFNAATRTYQADLQFPQSGDYMVTATASVRGTRLGEDRQLLICEGADREMADVRARPDLMAKLSQASRGHIFSLTESAASRMQSLFGKAPPVTIEHRRSPLWDRAWWLGTILGLLTIEWIVRRLSGLA